MKEGGCITKERGKIERSHVRDVRLTIVVKAKGTSESI